MGNISCSSAAEISPLPVADVLGLVGGAGATKLVLDRPVPDESKLRDELLALGVQMGGASVPDAVRCWQIVAEQDFWRNHYDSHPGKKRVKAWMVVHGKFRSSATSIVQAAESMHSGVEGGCSSTKTESAVGKIERSLRSLLGKVSKHSDFEDAQLFRFFKENLPDLEGQIRDLEADHSETNLGNEALDRVRNLRSAPTTAGAVSGGADVASAQAVVVALKAYAESLEIHLEREERVLVARWLNLSAEMYAKYRTYLVGKYRLVY